MDQDRTPVLEAIEQYRRGDDYTFALPGHRFGRGIDDRTRDVLGDAFAADVMTAKQAVSAAEELMAEVVGARQAVFTTCGSSISIHTAARVPDLHDLDLQQAMSPRDAFFAEMISPYPPGVPAVLPGERFNEAVVEYLRAGLAAGMILPDASDRKLETFRVVKD
jgi:arginine/lysine/ornithine decarboxylase